MNGSAPIVPIEAAPGGHAWWRDEERIGPMPNRGRGSETRANMILCHHETSGDYQSTRCQLAPRLASCPSSSIFLRVLAKIDPKSKGPWRIVRRRG